MSETIYKLQPDRTIYLRGMDGFGAAASIHSASPSGFTVTGVFRDQADFAVVVLHDGDNIFEHYSIRYLPDFNLSGLVLSFDLTTNGLQPIDSTKYSWIDWGILDVITSAGEPKQVGLWNYATLKSGTFTAAQGSFTVSTGSSGATVYDRITLFINNAGSGFDFVAGGGESASAIAANLAYQVNTHNWPAYADSSVVVIANVSGSTVTLTNAQAGHVNTSGTTVTWVDGQKFTGLTPGMQICLSGFFYTIASVQSATQLTLTTAPSTSSGGGTGVMYTAPRGGIDGNYITAYILVRPSNLNLSVDKTVIPLSGGVSDGLTWTISLDFTALGIDQLRQAWLTFAPQLGNGVAYSDTEWSAVFANWSVYDPNNIRALKVAGPGSVRIGNRDSWVTYSGSWSQVNANDYYLGFASVSNTAGDTITVKYACQSTHDVYIGGELYEDRGIVTISLDGDTATDLDMFLNVSAPVMSRRKVRSSIAPGIHTVVITVTNRNHQAQGPWDINSLGHYFLFDYLDAVVASDVNGAAVTYSNVTAALDYDTDATYKMTPQRVVWALKTLGLMGQVNLYSGVFWWNQRKRSGGNFQSASVTFGGTWAEGDTVSVNVGGFVMQKSVKAADTSSTIASHFEYYINCAATSVWASASGGVLTIHQRAAAWTNTVTATATSSSGTTTAGGLIPAGVDGTWVIDDSQSNPLNVAASAWHADFYATLASNSMTCSTAISMELVNPPDANSVGGVYCARFADGTVVATDTGFGSLISNHCALGAAKVVALQKAALLAYADLQNAAGLPVYLQFGEFLWWYFSSKQNVPIGYVSFTNPISIGVANPHGFSTGDRVVITGVQGCTAANGTWPVTVTDSTHFTIPVAANAAWVAGTGLVSGGSMAFYDAETSAAASSALGRELASFTSQDDDPTVNASADANFLANRLYSHISTLINAVKSTYQNAQFELLFPQDVTCSPLYWNSIYPYPQGGRLNHAVNFPSQFESQSGSGLNRLKMEALSWGSSYRSIDQAKAAIALPSTSPNGWPRAQTAYLVPIFNGGCPFGKEYLAAANAGVPLIVLWAYDHIGLMGWPWPLPANKSYVSAS